MPFQARSSFIWEFVCCPSPFGGRRVREGEEGRLRASARVRRCWPRWDSGERGVVSLLNLA